jgi:exodeoxyribonuclease VII large subunit
MLEERVYSVSELNRVARGLLEEGLGPVWVRGEVSNLVRAPSGHLYFTLKDEGSELAAVRFKGRVDLLPTMAIEDGISVLAYGRLTIYEPRGRYQFVVSLLQPAGLGAAQIAFEELKKRLAKEGLFDAKRKRALPPFPTRIGLVTSPVGAAIRDILSVLKRRWPLVEVYLFPSSVQGESAPEELVAAIARADAFSRTREPLELLIVGRGGGSFEDLSPFNDERVARAIAASPVPVVSAVGHEIDFTIADFVADLRAPTPSAAAELAVPDRSEVLASLSRLLSRALRAARAALERRKRTLETAQKAYIFRIPSKAAETASQGLDLRLGELLRAAAGTWRKREQEAARLEGLLRLVDPYFPLRRGYSLTFSLGNPTPLRDPSLVFAGERIETLLLKGKILSQVEEVAQN